MPNLIKTSWTVSSAQGSMSKVDNNRAQMQKFASLRSCTKKRYFYSWLSHFGTIHKQHLLRGEGGGAPQKEMKGDVGRNPVFRRGDIIF